MNNTASANKVTILYFVAVLLVAIYTCGQSFSIALAAAPPTLIVQIRGDYCPSVEVQSGMQIAWTNPDDMDRVLLIQRMDDQGQLVNSGGTNLLRAGDTYAISFNQPGQYTYYCSSDRMASGTITVLQ